jgi:hypothetical protein
MAFEFMQSLFGHCEVESKTHLPALDSGSEENITDTSERGSGTPIKSNSIRRNLDTEAEIA